MSDFPFLTVSITMKLIAVLFVFCAVILILIVLIQKGRGGGLSGAFAGGMTSGILGSKTGDFLTWVTVATVALFLTLSIVVAKYYKPYETSRSQTPTAPIEQQQQSPESPLVPDVASDINSDVNSVGK